MADEITHGPIGFEVFEKGESQAALFLEKFEAQYMQWLVEILEVAKKDFGKEDVKLLPKTPCAKKNARRVRRVHRSSVAVAASPPLRSTQPMSDFYKEAIQAASRHSPPLATPPTKKMKEEPPLSPRASPLDITQEILAPVDTAQPTVEPSPQSTRNARSARASTRASTAQTAARRTTRTRVVSKKGRGSKKSSIESQKKESESETTEKRSVPPVPRTRGTRASTRAATRQSTAQTATRQSTRTRLARKKRSAESTSESSAAETAGSVKSGKKAVGRLQTRLARAPPTPSTSGESKYKDHVKRLVKVHEDHIAKKKEEVSSPKRPRMCQAPSTPKTPTSCSGSPFRSSPILNLCVSAKKTDTAASNKRDNKGKKKEKPEIAVEKAKEVTAFFANLKTRPTRATSVTDTNQGTTKNEEEEKSKPKVKSPPTQKSGNTENSAGASAEKSVKETITPSPHKVEDETPTAEVPKSDVQAERAAADNTVLSQDSLEEVHGEDVTDGCSSSKIPKMELSSSSSSSLSMEEDSLMEEKSLQPRRSVRASSRRSSISVSKSKRRTSTYLRLHPRQSIRQSGMRRSTRLSKRLSNVHTIAAATPMERDSLESTKSQRSPRRSPRLAQRLNLDDSLEEEKAEKTAESSSSPGSSSSSSSDNIIDKTPSPDCPPSKVVRPHPKSFLNTLNAKKKASIITGTPSNMTGVITSFIQRNTPQKKTLKEQQESMKAQMMEKRRKEEEHRRKIEEANKKKREEVKRKREERMKRVQEARQQNLQLQMEKKQKMEERYEQKQMLTERQKEERKKEELQKRQAMEKKKAEAEERRKLELEMKIKKHKEQEESERRHLQMLERKKEYEEQERQRRAEEARRQVEQQRLRQEKQRLEEMVRKREQALAREKEQQKLKEEREREKKEIERRRVLEAENREKEKKAREEAERQRQIAAERAVREKKRQEEESHLKSIMEKEKMRQEHERLKANILKLNTSLNQQQHNTSSTLNSTFNKEKVENSPQSYDLTPQRIYVAASDQNYGIDDMHSDDSTDDEEAPKKKIPSWAQGGSLKTALINQHYHPPNFTALFPMIDPPDLEVMFAKKRARFFKRTSSAVWDSPIINHLR
ncbi:uncharacterized protein [Diadema antillarum]|uniref:uncharacterized protein n=1 Tax=Diadema antillarum TaxID=105358 RepID=UPI003A87BFA1